MMRVRGSQPYLLPLEEGEEDDEGEGEGEPAGLSYLPPGKTALQLQLQLVVLEGLVSCEVHPPALHLLIQLHRIRLHNKKKISRILSTLPL